MVSGSLQDLRRERGILHRLINPVSLIVYKLSVIRRRMRFLGLKASLMLGVGLRSKKPSIIW